MRGMELAKKPLKDIARSLGKSFKCSAKLK